MRRIRVAEILEATVGGTRRHLLDLLEGLDRNRFEVTAVVSLKRDPGFAREVARLRAEGIDVITIPMIRRPAPIADFIALFRLCRVLERGRFDVLHAHSSKAGLLARLAARIVGVPAVVYTPHGFAFMIRANRLLRSLYRLAERLARRWTDLFILVSPTEIEAAYEARLWPRAAPPHPVFVMIQNGIDPDTVGRDRNAARAALGLGDDDLVIASVGRLTRQKGHRYLVDAAQRVVSQLPSAKFVIIGEGELRHSLQRQIDRLGLGDFVRLAGQRDDVRRLYAGFDIFALPSLWEAGPYTLLEAQAAGCPTVATTAAACAELVGHGDAGICVPPANSDALAAAIIELLSDSQRRATMSQRATDRSRAPERRLETQIARTADLYQRLARHRIAAETLTQRQLFEADPRAPRIWERAVKRAVDAVGGAAALMLFAPVMAACAVLIKCDSPGPVLFRQDRVGFRGRRFRMWKFRSMRSDAEARRADLEDSREPSLPFFKMRRDPRVTRFGRLIRRLALDELPQLWNVVAGDMSLVGPRPLPARDLEESGWLRSLPPDDVARHRRWRDLRASVRPGLTGLWQVSGCSELDHEGWLINDLAYVHRWSLLLDTAILWRTLPVLVRGRRPNGEEAGP